MLENSSKLEFDSNLIISNTNRIFFESAQKLASQFIVLHADEISISLMRSFIISLADSVVYSISLSFVQLLMYCRSKRITRIACKIVTDSEEMKHFIFFSFMPSLPMSTLYFHVKYLGWV